MLERDNHAVGVGGNNMRSKTNWLGMWRSVLLENLVRYFVLAAVSYVNLCHMLLIRQNSNAEEGQPCQSLWFCVIAKQPSVKHLISS